MVRPLETFAGQPRGPVRLKREMGATLQIKAADTDVITGSKATGTMIDETHVFAKRSNAADVL